MNIKINTIGNTDTGKVREVNEDSFVINESKQLFIVADGMGGHNAGDVASKMACDLYSDKFNPNAEDIKLEMKAVFEQVNDDVFNDAKENMEHYGMRTTLIVSHIKDDTIHIAHAGDVRCYLLRDGMIKPLTEDHTLVYHLVKEGIITPEEAKKHPMRSQVAKSIGNEQKVDPDYSTETLKKGDIYLLCSDGLWNMLEDACIKSILEKESSLEDRAKILIDTANDNGGKDNITVLLIGIEEEAKVDKTATQTSETVEVTQTSEQKTEVGNYPFNKEKTGIDAVENINEDVQENKEDNNHENLSDE
jgi:protein phosphatase